MYKKIPKIKKKTNWINENHGKKKCFIKTSPCRKYLKKKKETTKKKSHQIIAKIKHKKQKREA